MTTAELKQVVKLAATSGAWSVSINGLLALLSEHGTHAYLCKWFEDPKQCNCGWADIKTYLARRRK